MLVLLLDIADLLDYLFAFLELNARTVELAFKGVVPYLLILVGEGRIDKFEPHFLQGHLEYVLRQIR